MKLLLLSGGRHPYAETTPILVDFLDQAGHEVTATEDASILARAGELAAFDALVFNTRRENLPEFGDLALTGAEREGMSRFVQGGKGFVCLHISTCRPAEWHGFHEITGGGWITGTSFHPPYGGFAVHIGDPGHEVVCGIGDFETEDELYMGLAHDDANAVFLTADADEGTHPWGPDRVPTHMPAGTFPLGWTRMYGRGRVFVLLLGHDARSFRTPEFQRLVLNGVAWSSAG